MDEVRGYQSLNQATVQNLMASEDLDVLTPSLQRSTLGQVITTPDALTAEVNRAAILVTHQWVVTIYGDSLAHCIDALVKYRNAVATQLATTVTGVLRTPSIDNTGPLHRNVMHRQKKIRMRNVVKNAGWMLAGAFVGAGLSILGCWILRS